MFKMNWAMIIVLSTFFVLPMAKADSKLSATEALSAILPDGSYLGKTLNNEECKAELLNGIVEIMTSKSIQVSSLNDSGDYFYDPAQIKFVQTLSYSNELIEIIHAEKTDDSFIILGLTQITSTSNSAIACLIEK